MGFQPPLPPNNPPAEVQDNVFKQNQDQEQDQFQNQNNTIGELLQEQKTNSDADSNSESDSTSVNSAQQSNVQINNNSNRIEFDGIKIPETTINLNGYVNDNDWGAVFGVNIPLGGRSRNLVNQGLSARVSAIEMENDRSFVGHCISLEKEGFVVTSDENYASKLADCGKYVVARNVPAPTPPPQVDVTVRNEITNLQQQNQELRSQIQLLISRLEERPVPGKF